jgi:hypothetical protein
MSQNEVEKLQVMSVVLEHNVRDYNSITTLLLLLLLLLLLFTP